jgi:hypothetical protein
MYYSADRSSRPVPRRAPSFRGTRDLKFTREEVAAIQAAEGTLQYVPLQRHGPRRVSSLFWTMLLALGLSLAADLVVTVTSRSPAADARPRVPSAANRVPHAGSPRSARSAPSPPPEVAAVETAPHSLPTEAPTPPSPQLEPSETPAPTSEAEPLQQTATPEPEAPPETQPVTSAQADTDTDQSSQTPIPVPSLSMAGVPFVPPTVERFPVARNDGSWQHFSTTPVRRVGGERFAARPWRWPRRPAPQKRSFVRRVITGAGFVMPPRGEFVIVSQPPFPSRHSIQDSAVNRRRWGQEGGEYK